MTEETIMSSISREELIRVAGAISEAGGAVDWKHALEVAEAAIAALSPDERLIEALTKCREKFVGYLHYDETGPVIQMIDEALGRPVTDRLHEVSLKIHATTKADQ